jgi:hypothetical protein
LIAVTRRRSDEVPDKALIEERFSKAEGELVPGAPATSRRPDLFTIIVLRILPGAFVVTAAGILCAIGARRSQQTALPGRSALELSDQPL